MRLLKFTANQSEPAVLTTKRLLLRRPQASDFSAWRNLRDESSDFLSPFEPSWSHDELSRSSFKARMRRQEAEITSGRALPWFIFDHTNNDQLLGGLTISNIRRGVSQTGTIGYWTGEPFAGKGIMTEALKAVCIEAFSNCRFHRLEAGTLLHNERSQRLLLTCGFQKEGTARQYLKINGEWCDHYLFARIASD